MNRSITVHTVVFLILVLIMDSACGLQSQCVQPYTNYVSKQFNDWTTGDMELQCLQILDFSKQDKIERDVTYCNNDGLDLKMDIYYPKSVSGLVPAVLFIHGGAWQMGDKTDIIDIPPLLARGYIIASINYRLAPQYRFPAQIEDAKCAVRFLRAHAKTLQLDIGHIGIIGISAGGHVAALLGVTDSSAGFDGTGGWMDQSSNVQAVVYMAGVTDLNLFSTEPTRNVLQDLFGKQNFNSENLTWASPLTYINRNAAPFYILHGEKDDIVPIEQSQILYNRLLSNGVPVTMEIVKNADHSFGPVGGQMSPDWYEITIRISNFFDQYLR